MVSKPKGANPKSETKGPNKETAKFEVGDIVLGKVKGFPQWPAKIIDAEHAPLRVQNMKPKGLKYCLRFFHSADYYWAKQGEISSLSKDAVDKYIADSSKKGGDLMNAYKLAYDHDEWEKDILALIQEEKEDQADYFNNNIDELDGVEEDDQLAEGSKKRKRKSEAGKKEEKESKKRKKENGSSTKDSTSKSSKKTETNSKKTKTEEAPESSGNGTTDQSLTIVQSWRHKLQRAFLGKTDPKPEEMPGCAKIFDDIEKFDMQAEWLRETKLVKVLKRIATGEDDKVPRDSEFHFKERSQALINKWSELLKKDDKKEAGDVTVGDLTVNGNDAAEESNGKTEEANMDTSDG